MFGSAIIDVAVGLIFIYFILSVIVSHVNELVAGVFSWRATLLEDGIRQLLGDPQLAKRVLDHPLIARLTAKAGRRPSHIPSQLFALALFDALVPPKGRESLAGIDGAVMQLPDGAGRDTLISLLRHAGADLDKKRAAVENWFDAAMDRLSGVYKRQVQWVGLALAALFVVLLGVDTVSIASTLWQDQGIRAVVTGAAQHATDTALEDAVNTLSEFALPLGWPVYPATVVDWIIRVVGLAITTLAVSLGSPFWFDLLNRMNSLRASGPKPQKAAKGAQEA